MICIHLVFVSQIEICPLFSCSANIKQCCCFRCIVKSIKYSTTSWATRFANHWAPFWTHREWPRPLSGPKWSSNKRSSTFKKTSLTSPIMLMMMMVAAVTWKTAWDREDSALASVGCWVLFLLPDSSISSSCSAVVGCTTAMYLHEWMESDTVTTTARIPQ